jgi:hypothetical protein
MSNAEPIVALAFLGTKKVPRDIKQAAKHEALFL